MITKSNKIDVFSEYAKKIYGFAYSKTNDLHNAQDLSQDILLQLCKMGVFDSEKGFDGIADIDGFIYRICQYTWSNYVRKNIKDWKYSSELDETTANEIYEGGYLVEESAEREVLKNETYKALRREIMRLGKNKRDILIMFYYDGLTGREISEKLDIPHSTVRWYLSETKKILKERIEMTDTIFIPKRLKVYFCGNSNSISLAGLREELLVQNICLACQEKAVSVEEIAGKMCTAAPFIEEKLDELLYMNYIEKTGTNKYKCTFFIQNTDYIMAKVRFDLGNIPPVANAIYNAVNNNYDRIIKIGFTGCGLNKDFLMWAFTAVAAHLYEYKNSLNCGLPAKTPIRGDGSAHWIDASYSFEDVIKEISANESEELIDYYKYSNGMAGKYNGNKSIGMQQFDPPIMSGDRDILTAPEMSIIYTVYKLTKSNGEYNEDEKEMISFAVSRGYACMRDGKVNMTVPVFTKGQYEEFCDIMEKYVLKEVNDSVGKVLPEKYAEYIEKYIPDHVSPDERDFLRSRFYHPNAYTYLLYKEGLLKDLTDKERKCVCTVMWEN